MGAFFGVMPLVWTIVSEVSCHLSASLDKEANDDSQEDYDD